MTWQKPNTGIVPHNVFSCTAPQAGCAGQAATETFSSGTATGAPFNFSHTFVQAGSDPYVCQIHATMVSMQGKVTVTAPPPPAVPQLVVGKLASNGSGLKLQWNAALCSSATHHLVFGADGGLPATPGGVYTLAGGVCGIGASPFNWLGVPLPSSGHFLWFLMLAHNAASVEGSWGHDSFGNERNGSGAGGSSGQCGITGKSLTNACGL